MGCGIDFLRRRSNHASDRDYLNKELRADYRRFHKHEESMDKSNAGIAMKGRHVELPRILSTQESEQRRQGSNDNSNDNSNNTIGYNNNGSDLESEMEFEENDVTVNTLDDLTNDVSSDKINDDLEIFVTTQDTRFEIKMACTDSESEMKENENNKKIQTRTKIKMKMKMKPQIIIIRKKYTAKSFRILSSCWIGTIATIEQYQIKTQC